VLPRRVERCRLCGLLCHESSPPPHQHNAVGKICQGGCVRVMNQGRRAEYHKVERVAWRVAHGRGNWWRLMAGRQRRMRVFFDQTDSSSGHPCQGLIYQGRDLAAAAGETRNAAETSRSVAPLFLETAKA
jgi:hypothetical protein